MSLWGRIFAAGYDTVMKGPEEATFRAHREALLSRVRGRVIEIGGGTGANLPFYSAAVDELVITEPEEPMARRLERKLGDHRLPVRVVHAPAEALPFEDATFDFAVSTLVLCTVEDPQRALGEVRRLLKPGGRLLFLEHVRSDDPKLARWQDRLQPLQFRLGHGCHCNRPTLDNVTAAGLTVAELEHDTVRKAPPIVRPLIVGAAERIDHTTGGRTMSPDDNKALVRRFYKEIDAGNLDAMDELVSEDYVNHSPFPFPVADGREGLKQAFKILWEATPGTHDLEDQVAEGDRVVTRLTAHGRHEGDLPGPIPASGNELHMSAVAIHRIADGKIVEHWSGKDELGLMIQLGVIEPPGQGG